MIKVTHPIKIIKRLKNKKIEVKKMNLNPMNLPLAKKNLKKKIQRNLQRQTPVN